MCYVTETPLACFCYIPGIMKVWMMDSSGCNEVSRVSVDFIPRYCMIELSYFKLMQTPCALKFIDQIGI